MRPRPAGDRRPYWTIPALFLALAVPLGLAGLGLLAAAGVTATLAVARTLTARRARAADARRSDAGVVLGQDAARQPVVISDRQLSAHALILGASGAGKSTSLLQILTDHIRRGTPVVAVDMKGSPSFAGTLARAAASAGRPFALWTPDGGAYWNPLAHGNPTELKDKLIATERFTEPHYQRAAERYVQTVLRVLAQADPNRAPTLGAVVELMDPARLSAVVRRLPRAAAGRTQDYLATLTPDQISAVRGLGTRLAIISESHTGAFLEPAPGGRSDPTIDVRAALRGPEVILFSLNSSTYGKLSAQLGTLAVQDLVSAVGDRLTRQAPGQAAAQAIIAIDEFSALGSDNVISLLARGRESGASVLLATQELADLDRAAPGLRDQVLGNTAVKLAHRQDVPASAQTIAQMAGTERVWDETEQIGSGLLGDRRAGRGTRRQVEQFVVHPNEIKSLPTGRAVLITKLPTMRTRTVDVRAPQRRERPGPELG
jgi:conjugal transfer pilus assembly protein TraD